MKNQSGTIKTNPELYRVVMGGSGGYRRLPGGSDHFSLQTNRQTLHHNIYHQQPHHHLITIVIAIFTTITNLICIRGIATMMLCCIHAPSFKACYCDNLKITIMFSNCFQWAVLNLFNTMDHQDQQEQRKRFIGCQIGNGQKFEGPPEQEYMKL